MVASCLQNIHTNSGRLKERMPPEPKLTYSSAHPSRAFFGLSTMEQKTKCFDERPILPDKQAASPNKNSRMISADERGQKKMPQRRIIVANFNK